MSVFEQALARALLHSLWEGAAIALLLGAMLQCLRSGSARVCYAAACTALFAMPLAFAITLWRLLPAGLDQVGTASTFRLSGLVLLHPSGPLVADPNWAEWAMRWLVPAWLMGVAGFYAYSLAGWISAQRLRRVGVCPAPAIWQERLRVLAARLGITRTVSLFESCLAGTPVVVGVFRPVILAPIGILAGMPTDQVESILLHELAHIRRYDYLVNLVQRLVEGLFFYHPAAWWISNLVRTEREFCCDDLVVELSGDPRCYAEALSTLEQRRWTANQAALAANGGKLMTRIRRLLQKNESPRIGAAPVAGLLLLLITAALAAWQPVPKPAPIPPAQTPVPPAAEVKPLLIAQAPRTPARPAAAPRSDPFQKWLNEEAAYIITDQEREAFASLTGDDQRQRFIEQFWARRDPTPNSEENEYKEEHYRRIAFVNDRFFTGTQPGWMTDRGALYISHGPPDAIDVHSGVPGVAPSQIWHYRHIDGIGNDVMLELVDSNGTNDYQLLAPKDGARSVYLRLHPTTQK